MEIVFCYGGNKKLGKIACDVGYKWGARYPSSVVFPLYFADQDWKAPNRDGYMKFLSVYRPVMATVIDYDDSTTLDVVLDWASEAAQYVQNVIIIPKIPKTIRQIPTYINQTRIILGYSVPTKYGSTRVSYHEFSGWPIHLLGGSIKTQYFAFENLRRVGEVISLDGNYSVKKSWLGQYWSIENPFNRPYGSWKQAKDSRTAYELFECSAKNLFSFWKSL